MTDSTPGLPEAQVGLSIPRRDLRRLITGNGRFVADIADSSTAHAVIVRAGFAHGDIIDVDVSAARALPGVLDVITPDDADDALRPLHAVWRYPGMRGTATRIASRTVRYAAQPIGVIVAESRAVAEDAACLVSIKRQERPAVAELSEALAEGAPLLHEDWDSNQAGSLATGSKLADIEALFADAPHVLERNFRFHPIVSNPLETRGLVAAWDPLRHKLDVSISTQAPHDVRDQISEVLGLPLADIRVRTPDVGGAFGSKVHVYPDELLVCLAAVRRGGAVSWIEDRDEHMVATDHGRDALHRARVAFDDDGTLLAIYDEILGNLGAYPASSGIGPFFVSTGNLHGPYRWRAAGGSARAVITNTTPTGSYRGFGNAEASFVRERLVDEVARYLGRDPVDLRLQNMIGPDEMPYQTTGHAKFDSGDYPAALHEVRHMVAAWQSTRQVPDDGRRRGIGYGFGVEYTGLAPARDLQWIGFNVAGHETATVEMMRDGTVIVRSPLTNMGQGLETAFAQIAADELGISMGKIHVELGDTADGGYASAGSHTSRSVTVGGPAVAAAARRVRNKLAAVASHLLEVDDSELVFADDHISVTGEPATATSIAEIANRAILGWNVPDGFTPGLAETAVYLPEGIAYSYACAAAAVAIDPSTGVAEVERAWMAHDSGTIVNPGVVLGQLQGGMAQALGNVFLEQYTPDDRGGATSTLETCDIPQTTDVPDMEAFHLEFPSPITPGGMKGVGEAGTIVALGTFANAIAAALPEIAESVVQAPMTARRIRDALRATSSPPTPK